MKNLLIYRSAKLNAFTLFESVVAISIITVLVGLGAMIYGNLMDAEKPMAYYQAQNHIDELFQELQETQGFLNRDFDLDQYQIEQRVSPYNGNKRLYLVEYTVFQATDKLWTEKHLVTNE